MIRAPQNSKIALHVADALYTEAMVLADEARCYFDLTGRAERLALSPAVRVGVSCESLKVTTRLMYVIAWLLTQRAVEAGEIAADEALDPSRRLGDAPTTQTAVFADLPARARALIDASIALHRRVALLDRAQASNVPVASPARSMQERLALAF